MCHKSRERLRTLKCVFIVLNGMQLYVPGLITMPVMLDFNDFFVSFLKHADASCNDAYYTVVGRVY